MAHHDPDFLYIWQPVSPEGQAYAPGGTKSILPGVARPKTASEAEALRLWLADGDDLDHAFLYGLKILIDEGK